MLPSYTVSVAPMMDCTDRHFRYIARLFSPSVLLYTEMISATAIIHGNRRVLLSFHPQEHPISLQIGSGDPVLCARAVEVAEPYGYDEYNLNVGCPSPKVRCGMFGAQLMGDPHRVAKIVQAMKSVTDKPVTVKHRLGIDPHYRYSDFRAFCEVVSNASPDRFIAHARIALLGGLSPKANRTIPPIMYDEVYRIKQDLPHLTVEINGEVSDAISIQEQLQHVDGVMIGREVCRNPRMLLSVEQSVFGNAAHTISDDHVIARVIAYIRECEDCDVRMPIHRMCAHLSTLYYRRARARKWRRSLHDEITRATTLSNSARLQRALEIAYREVTL